MNINFYQACLVDAAIGETVPDMLPGYTLYPDAAHHSERYLRKKGDCVMRAVGLVLTEPPPNRLKLASLFEFKVLTRVGVTGRIYVTISDVGYACESISIGVTETFTNVTQALEYFDGPNGLLKILCGRAFLDRAPFEVKRLLASSLRNKKAGPESSNVSLLKCTRVADSFYFKHQKPVRVMADYHRLFTQIGSRELKGFLGRHALNFETPQKMARICPATIVIPPKAKPNMLGVLETFNTVSPIQLHYWGMSNSEQKVFRRDSPQFVPPEVSGTRIMSGICFVLDNKVQGAYAYVY